MKSTGPIRGTWQSLRQAYQHHDTAFHTAWAGGWTAILVVAAIAAGEEPRLWWAAAAAVLLGVYHLGLRVGRRAERAGVRNALTRRSTLLAWWGPVLVAALAIWETAAG